MASYDPFGTATDDQPQNSSGEPNNESEPLTIDEENNLNNDSTENEGSVPEELGGTDEGDQAADPDDAERKEEDESKTAAVGTQTTKKSKYFPTLYNPLHNYASYTYSISLHSLSKQEFNQSMVDPLSWVPENTLIAGAGRRGVAGFTRNEFFHEDFYIDNLSFETTAAGSGEAKGTSNILELKFDIFEPFGMTLVSRLMEVAASPRQQAIIDASPNTANTSGNWTELLYMIQIDFFGYWDDGVPQSLTDLTKYIPVKITGMKMRTGAKGTEYNVIAVPTPSVAFNPDILSTPVAFEVQASTLSEFFDTGVIEESIYSDQFREDKEREEARAKEEEDEAKKDVDTKSRDNTKKDPGDTKSAAKKADDEAKEKSMYKVRSYTAAYNAWNASIVENKYSNSYNEIRVVFADEILAKERIVQPAVQAVNQTPTTDRGGKGDTAPAKKTARAIAGIADSGPNTELGKFSIAAGDTITNVIDRVMQQTDYWRDQFIDPTKMEQDLLADSGFDASATFDSIKKASSIEGQAAKKDVVRSWKICPRVEYKEYDEIAGRWTCITTWYVIVDIKYNRSFPNAPRAFPVGWHRRYDYIYTGKNIDILDWQIDFDFGDITNVVIDRGKGQATAGAQASPGQEDDTEQDPDRVKELSTSESVDVDQKESAKKTKPGTGVNPVTYRYIPEDAKASATGNMRKDSTAQLAGAMYSHVYSSAASHSKLKLKIVGDPCYIKQDEIFYPPDLKITSSSLHSGEQAYLLGGTIRQDGAPVHARITFKSPVDVDPESGLMRENSKFQTMTISGLYDLIKCVNTFSHGKFEQDLEFTRLADQDEDLAEAEAANGESDRDKKAEEAPKSSENGESKTATDDNPPDSGDEDNATDGDENETTDQDEDENRDLRDVNETETVDQADGTEIVDSPFGTSTGTVTQNNPVDPANLPGGVAYNEAVGLPEYQGQLYEGTAKDIDAWKASIDAKQPFKYTVTDPNNGNQEIRSTQE